MALMELQAVEVMEAMAQYLPYLEAVLFTQVVVEVVHNLARQVQEVLELEGMVVTTRMLLLVQLIEAEVEAGLVLAMSIEPVVLVVLELYI